MSQHARAAASALAQVIKEVEGCIQDIKKPCGPVEETHATYVQRRRAAQYTH